MADIAERAAEHGARWVLTYCEENNVPSIKACRSAGLEPWRHRDERWRLLRSRYRCTEVTSPSTWAPLPSSGGRSLPPRVPR
jgi:hypothetical protein